MSRRVDGVEESSRFVVARGRFQHRRIDAAGAAARGSRASRERCRDTQVLKIIEGHDPVLCIETG